MNILLAALAAVLSVEVLKKNTATEKGLAQETLSSKQKESYDRLMWNYNNLDSNATRVVAEMMAINDDAFKPVYKMFQIGIGVAAKTGRYEAFVMLTSLGDTYHSIPRDTSFLVIHGKNRHAIDYKGKVIGYDENPHSSRLATKEEIEKYFANLQSAHLASIASNELLAPYIELASDELSKAAIKKVKKTKEDEKATVATSVTVSATN